jgi:outer membrane protein assembly factor BamD (BamD/ComL family)
VAELRARVSEAVAGHDLPTAARGYLELKALDPAQVLSRQAQLDVANQFAQEQRFGEAAEAYETFLRHYPKYEQTEQVELMLGIVLNRFLTSRPAPASTCSGPRPS